MTGVLRQKQKMMKFTALLQDDLRKKPGEKYVFLLCFPIILDRRKQYQVANLEEAFFQSY